MPPTIKKINVTVQNHNTMKVLRDGKYSLCLLKDVEFNGEISRGNVIFATISPNDLSANMQLEWQESYQVFETEQGIIAGEHVKYDTATPDVQPYDKIIFKANAFERQNQPDHARIVVNEWKDLARVGVRCCAPKSVEDDKFVPFYLSPVRPYQAPSGLIPVDSFILFFSSEIGAKAGTIVDLSRVPVSNSRFEFKEGCLEGTVLYDDSKEKDKFWEADQKSIEKL